MSNILIELKKMIDVSLRNVDINSIYIDEVEELNKTRNYNRIVEKISGKLDIDILEEDYHFFNYTGMRLDWDNSKNNGFHEYLFGGFDLYGINSALVYPTKFHESYYTPELSNRDKNLISQLGYFQKSGHGDDGVFGCLLREKGVYPPKLYLFDHNVIFPLDMTFQQYFDNMLKCNAVTLWQYFFIEPEVIVDKLKDISIEKWHSLYEDKLGDVSRAHGVLAHMEKVVRMFPRLFPDTDITFFQEKYDALEKALKEL